ncbi:hypothetical protein CERSUDRAFT_74048 [Gelatoporia subvermispora B]|uniref:Alcohol dehydrogenase-like C-terminal domain-containing protein n=1 Tax=Ceriporiopsis subvermispora (strain B) TaxID=914234 RepID=M2QY29_CERS8|nr:hypothetical protein CERSUDRAFT_74048 [Gelatoporia subvermispora B]
MTVVMYMYRHYSYIGLVHAQYHLERRRSIPALERRRAWDILRKTYTLEIAKLSGFSPIITTASLHNADKLKELGAKRGLDITAPGGYLVILLPGTVDPVKKASQLRHVILHLGATGPGLEESKRVWSTLTGLVEKGVIKPTRVQTLSGGLAGIVEGCDLLKNDKISATQLIVRPQETP